MLLLQVLVRQLRIKKPEHLTSGMTLLRRHALASMNSHASAHAALYVYTSHVHAWLNDHKDLLHPINLAAALGSVAQLWQRAGAFGVSADELKLMKTATVHKLADLFMTQPQQEGNYSVCRVFWSLARLDVLPRYEAALAEMFLATQHESSMTNVSTFLWGMSKHSINPLNGRMLEGIVSRIQVRLSDPSLDPKQETQVSDHSTQTSPCTLININFHFTRCCV